MNTLNTFNNGMVLDTHPLSTPNTVLTNCLNGTLVTRNGNEMILLNDSGNSTIIYENTPVSLTEGYIPVGLKEFGGILYIFSVNPTDYRKIEITSDEYDETNPNHTKENNKYYENQYSSEIGTYPSPQYPDDEDDPMREDLINKYQPLHNLKNVDDEFVDFRTYSLNLDLYHPLQIDALKSYDGSINLIFTDNKNIPRLINTRFSLYGNNKFEIVDRSGENDSNVYLDDDTFTYTTSLHKLVNQIVDINFDDVLENGNLLVGNYTFYFKLADSDDNESDFIGQSGIVTCHKGALNDPHSIDGGIADENAYKQVKFTLEKIPKQFSRVYVYYSRNTCDENGVIITYYRKINKYYEVDSEGNSNILITGFESTEQSDFEGINTNYLLVDTAKTQSITSDILFYGNLKQNTDKYLILKDAISNSDNITVNFCTKAIGRVSTENYSFVGDNPEPEYDGEYYNVHNIYDYVGYWPGEYYRFGMVLILEDGSLTPVFNIPGNIPVDDGDTTSNKYGIILIPETVGNAYPIRNGSSLAFGIKFSLNQNLVNLFKKNKIKGYFYTRQKRIKNTICLAVKIGFDRGYSNLPVLRANFNSKFVTSTEPVPERVVTYTGIIDKKIGLYKLIGKYELNVNYPSTVIEFNSNSKDAVTNKLILLLDSGIYNESDPDNKYWEPVPIINNEIDWNSLQRDSFFVPDNTTNPDIYYNFYNNPDSVQTITISGTLYRKATTKEVVKKSEGEERPDWFTETFLRNRDDLIENEKSSVFSNYIKDSQQGYSKKVNLLLDSSIITKSNAKAYTSQYEFGLDYLEEKMNSEFREKNDYTLCEAAICPEFEVNQPLYNSMFTSSKFKIKSLYTLNVNKSDDLRHYYLNVGRYNADENHNYNRLITSANIQAVPENSLAIKNKNNFYSSRVGNDSEIQKGILPFTNWYTLYDGYNSDLDDVDGLDITDGGDFSFSPLVRGIWGPYLGVEYDSDLEKDRNEVYSVFNIYPKGILFDKKILGELRKLDSSEFYPITKRYDLNKNLVVDAYGGDCFICNFTHRMNRNFTDPEFPMTDEIANNKSFYINYRISTDKGLGIEHSDNHGTTLYLIHKRDISINNEKLSEINRTDVNAVQLGHWLTTKIMASSNLSMRSSDGSHIQEKAITGNPRSFYPLRNFSTSSSNKMPDSYLLNEGYAKTTGEQVYYELEDVPALKTNYSNRIVYSNIAVKDAYVNNLRVFLKSSYQDYTRLYGEIVKIMNFKDSYLFCVFEHALALIEVNERAVLNNSNSGLSYIDVNKVLSDKPNFLTTEFGSQWADSVILTSTGFYGVDTVAKKIWKVDTLFEVISDFMISKFLKDNLLVNENNAQPNLTKLNVKSHYNKAKLDIMFTFFKVKDDNDYIGWNICYNEITKKWTTFYSWIPSYSGNIDNTFYSFNNEESININRKTPVNYLWQHGVKNKWCNWYNELHPFEFEFVIAENPLLHKILNNLQLIANKTKPESFHFEIIGEVYNFTNDKENMYYRQERTKELYKDANIYYDSEYKLIEPKLNNVSTIFPLYVSRVDKTNKLYDTYQRMTSNSLNYEDMSGSEIVKDETNNEYNIAVHMKAYPIDGFKWVTVGRTEELSGYDLLLQYYNYKGIEYKIDGEYLKKKVYYGRRYGNCDYKEDLWKVQVPAIDYIQVNENKWQEEPPICASTNPIPEEDFIVDFPNDTVIYPNAQLKQTRIRDKYIKVKVRYDGRDLAVISAILSMYTESYN